MTDMYGRSKTASVFDHGTTVQLGVGFDTLIIECDTEQGRSEFLLELARTVAKAAGQKLAADLTGPEVAELFYSEQPR